MRDIRISLLLLISFVLLLASFLVLCIWGYKFYNSRDKQAVVTKAGQVKQDSLLLLYNTAIGKLEEKLVHTSTAADSLGQNIDGRLQEFYRLKNELTQLLQNASTNEDFAAARKKIDELQQSIKDLRRTNQNISKENLRLYELLSQIRNNIEAAPVQTAVRSAVSNSPSNNTISSLDDEEENDFVEVPVKPAPAANKTAAAPAIYSATDLNLEKIGSKSESDQMELVGSFSIKNNPKITTNDDLMIVVIQPNGKVLQKSAWESGTFQTTEGKKIYSCKLRIENPQGPVRRVTFSLNGDKQLTGNYVLQVYHKGWMIGNVSKRV